jgi:hypothetical protein
VAAYADDLRVRDARAQYFADNGFAPDGGYQDDWVRFKIGPLPIAFPNSPGRKAAVPRHDLHHVATGYDTDLAGEAEIGAWEIASGCFHVRAAWLLNMLAAWPVLFYAPGRVFRAFVRGRHSRNLYDGAGIDARLDENVGDLRARCAVNGESPEANTADRLAFARFVATEFALQVAILAVFVGVPAWLLGAFD